MVDLLDSLVCHDGLCVTAIKNTEGGGAAAVKINIYRRVWMLDHSLGTCTATILKQCLMVDEPVWIQAETTIAVCAGHFVLLDRCPCRFVYRYLNLSGVFQP